MRTIRWISRTISNRKWLIALLALLQSLNAASGILFALLMREVINYAVARNRDQFIYNVILLCILILFQIVVRCLNRYFEERARVCIENRLRQNAFRNILMKDYKAASGYHTGELMNRITSDATVVTENTVTLVPGLLSMAIKIVGVLLVLYTIEPLLTLFLLVGGGIMTFAGLLPRKWLKRLHRRVQEKDGIVRSFFQECLSSLLIIHTFGCEEKMDRAGLVKMEDYRRARMRRGNVSNLFSTALGATMQLGYIVGFVWCGAGILQGSISYGTLTAVIQLIGQIQAPIANLGGMFPKIAAMLASAERLIELENPVSDALPVSEQSVGDIYAQMEGICFNHISFRYDKDKDVLTDENFTLYKGLTAMIGASGIGKSTIMKLLLSVYTPDSGEIYIKMRDKKIPVGDLPSGLFAYVPQGNHLMSGTIREVVGFADPSDQIDQERVVQACKAACAHDFIMKLPQKYDTLLGEKGAGLSEGQMQRLAVARAIYSECPILLLDEATSALDVVTEAALMRSLKSMTDRTVLLVSHRKEILALCDRVLERKEKLVYVGPPAC